MPGEGKLTITGQLGDVMRESAQAALSYVRSHSRELAPDSTRTGSPSTTSTSTCPPGAIPKDGPSAGITMATALVSLLTGRPVRDDVAMTGEITLTGQVLPIGGLKEKALAAQRNGVAHDHRARAQRARHRGHPRAPARRPRVRVRRRDRRGPRRWRSEPPVGQRPQALACSRAEPGIGSRDRTASNVGEVEWQRRSKRPRRAVPRTGASPYVQRLIEDAELRENIRDAFESARKAYGRLTNGKPATQGRSTTRSCRRRCGRPPSRCATPARPCARAPRRRRSVAARRCCSSHRRRRRGARR